MTLSWYSAQPWLTPSYTSPAWTAYFIAALGWGSVLGSCRHPAKGMARREASKHAPIALLLLGVSVVVFTMGFSIQASLVAAIVAGAAGLFTGTAAQTALLGHQEKTTADIAAVTSVAALWAIAWAGTKPFASLLDGWLASHTDIVFTSIALAAPAMIISLCELLLPKSIKMAINDSGERLTSSVISRSTSPDTIFSDIESPSRSDSPPALLSPGIRPDPAL